MPDPIVITKDNFADEDLAGFERLLHSLLVDALNQGLLDNLSDVRELKSQITNALESGGSININTTDGRITVVSADGASNTIPDSIDDIVYKGLLQAQSDGVLDMQGQVLPNVWERNIIELPEQANQPEPAVSASPSGLSTEVGGDDSSSPEIPDEELILFRTNLSIDLQDEHVSQYGVNNQREFVALVVDAISDGRLFQNAEGTEIIIRKDDGTEIIINDVDVINAIKENREENLSNYLIPIVPDSLAVEATPSAPGEDNGIPLPQAIEVVQEDARSPSDKLINEFAPILRPLLEDALADAESEWRTEPNERDLELLSVRDGTAEIGFALELLGVNSLRDLGQKMEEAGVIESADNFVQALHNGGITTIDQFIEGMLTLENSRGGKVVDKDPNNPNEITLNEFYAAINNDFVGIDGIVDMLDGEEVTPQATPAPEPQGKTNTRIFGG